MAKKVVATLKTAGTGKSVTRCIKMVKSEKSGAYTFKSEFLPNEQAAEFFSKK